MIVMQEQWTALMNAGYKGHVKVVEMLLAAGANLDLQTKVYTVYNLLLNNNVLSVSSFAS